MDLATAARMALTAAAGHAAEEREVRKGLTERQRILLDRALNDRGVYSVLQEHFAALVLRQWGLAAEVRAATDDKTPTVELVMPPEAKGEP